MFAFMGDGILKKDNELTLRVVEEAIHALFSVILKTSASQYHRRLLEVSQVFAKCLTDIPIHRRPRILKSLITCVSHEHLWIVVAAIFDNICMQWKRDNSSDQSADSLTDICLEFVSTLKPEQQFQFSLNILDYVIDLGDDSEVAQKAKHKRFPTIFVRKGRPIQKLRHFRYVLIGIVLKAVNQPVLYEKVSSKRITLLILSIFSLPNYRTMRSTKS
jgi:hypothetical protein